MVGPASPDLLQQSREISRPIPQCDVINPEPAVIMIAPPAYVLFPIDDHLMAWIHSRHRRFLLFRSRRASLRLGHRVRWLRHRFAWIRYLRISLHQDCRCHCFPRAAATRSGSADSGGDQCSSPKLVVVCMPASNSLVGLDLAGGGGGGGWCSSPLATLVPDVSSPAVASTCCHLNRRLLAPDSVQSDGSFYSATDSPTGQAPAMHPAPTFDPSLCREGPFKAANSHPHIGDDKGGCAQIISIIYK